MTQLRTFILLAALAAVFVVAGYLIAGAGGAAIAFVFALATNGYAFWQSDRLALSRHNARVVTPYSHPDLHDMTRRLADNAGLPMPALYVIDSRQANAFATGRNPGNAAVAVTLGLLNTLDPDEIAGVIAHELAHIKNRDTLIMTVAATVAGAVSALANIGFLLGGNRSRGQFGILGVLIAVFLAPLAAGLIQMTISRTREYGADREGAAISGQPLALARALEKISQQTEWVQMPSAEAAPTTAHMFIINPLIGMRLDRLFATHPPAELRIAALEKMAAEGRYTAPDRVRRPLRPSDIPVVIRRK